MTEKQKDVTLSEDAKVLVKANLAHVNIKGNNEELVFNEYEFNKVIHKFFFTKYREEVMAEARRIAAPVPVSARLPGLSEGSKSN